MRRSTPGDAAANVKTQLGWLEQQLADGRPFVCGQAASIADFAIAQSIWYIERVPPVNGVLAPFTKTMAELRRDQFDQRLADEAGLARARHAGDGSEDTQRDVHVQPVQVVAADGFEPQPPLWRAGRAPWASGVREKIARRARRLDLLQPRRRPAVQHMALSCRAIDGTSLAAPSSCSASRRLGVSTVVRGSSSSR